MDVPNRNGLPQCHKKSSWQGRQSLLCQKENEQDHLSKLQNREVGESQVGKVPHLGEEGESELEHGVERVSCALKEGRFQGREGGQETISMGRSWKKHEQVNGGKGFPGESGESRFHSKSGQT